MNVISKTANKGSSKSYTYIHMDKEYLKCLEKKDCTQTDKNSRSNAHIGRYKRKLSAYRGINGYLDVQASCL